MNEKSNTYRVYSSLKSGQKRPLGRLRRRRENNNEMNTKEAEWESVTGLRWLRVGTNCRLL
jgi:hypothetical protein